MPLTQYRIHHLQLTVPTGATSVSGVTDTIVGAVKAVKVYFTNSTPGDSSDRDVDIREMNPFDPDDTSDAIQHILDVGGLGAAPAADNGVYYPRVQSQDYQGTGVTFDGSNEIYEPPFVSNTLQVDVSSAAAGDITDVYIITEE